jgi:hypothetical protein
MAVSYDQTTLCLVIRNTIYQFQLKIFLPAEFINVQLIGKMHNGIALDWARGFILNREEPDRF